MKTTTYYVLKPEEAETIYITLDQQTVFDLVENSTSFLNWCELELNEEAQEIIDLHLEEWISIPDFKIPYKKTTEGYEFDALETSEFLGFLIEHPPVIQNLISLEYWKEYPHMTTPIEHEIFQQLAQIDSKL